MEPVIEEFLRRFYAAWFLISTSDSHFAQGEDTYRRRRKERKQREIAKNIGSVLIRALWASRVRILSGCVPGEDQIGFSIPHDALWYRRDDIMDFLMKELLRLAEEPGVDVPLDAKAYDLTYVDRPFARQFARFINSPLYERWLDHELDASDLLDRSITTLLSEAEIVNCAVPFPGIPIGGTCNSVVWIGLRTREHLAQRLADVADVAAEKPLATALRKLSPRLRARMIAADAEQFGKKTKRPETPADTPMEAESEPPRDISVLRLDARRDYDVLVLQAVFSVEFFGLTPAPGYLVRLITDTFATTVPPTEEARTRMYQEAIFRLEAEGWIKEDPWHDFDTWHALNGDWQIGVLDLPPWVLRNHHTLRTWDWRTLLGAQALGWNPENTQQVLAIVEAVAPTLESDDKALPMYAEALARSTRDDSISLVTLLDQAEALIRRFSGPKELSRRAWIAITQRHFGNHSPGFYRCVTMLDDETVSELVTSPGREFQFSFERFGRRASRRPEHLPTMRRFAAAMDAQFPEEQPGCTERLEQWIEEEATREQK